MRACLHYNAAILLFTAQSAFAYGSGTYGLPNYLDVATFTINNYMAPTSSLSRSHADGESFYFQMHSSLAAKYPAINCNRQFASQDADVTWAKYTASRTYSSEFVFFSGHGSASGVYAQDNQSVTTGEKTYGGWTRWPFFSVCLALNNKDPNHYTAMFNGAHAVFGYESISWEFIHPYNCYVVALNFCAYHRSEDVWAQFSYNWINKGMFMYDAYVEAVQNVIYSTGGHGVAPAAVYCYGNVNGTWFIGGTEKVTNMFNGDVSFASLNKTHRYEKYGTPDY